MHKVWVPKSWVAPVGGDITAKNDQKWALEAEMGPKEAKTAQNGHICPLNDPKPRKKVLLRKVTLSPCVRNPNSRVAAVGGHITAKKWPEMGPWRPKWAQKGPTATSNKQAGFIQYLGYADRLRPQT